MKISNITVNPFHPESLFDKALSMSPYKKEEVRDYRILKESVDARKKSDVKLVYTVEIGDKPFIDEELSFPKTNKSFSPIIVGSGPSGLFCAYYLAKSGCTPTVIERGASIEKRRLIVNAFLSGGKLDRNSNVQFGEGGAGTFSDGKLTTLVGSPLQDTVLRIFIDNGAPKEIAYQSKPHIGTDLLTKVITNMREEIIALGGKFLFETTVTDIIQNNERVIGVKTDKGDFFADDIVLALGHSARDTIETLYDRGVFMEQKDFSMGFRIEHKQSDITISQYGEKYASATALPPASYKLVSHTPFGSVYTFCMCPGGEVINASSEEGKLAVNGMSYHARKGENANSALLCTLTKDYFGDSSPLAGISLQRKYEEKAFRLGGNDYTAPVQGVGEFLGGKRIQSVSPTCKPYVKECNLSKFFSENTTKAFQFAIRSMAKQLNGFDEPGAVLTAVESRSSSPVRITRNEHFESVSTKGLYPAGEGAGYSGGIVSSAIDGIKIAQSLLLRK